MLATIIEGELRVRKRALWHVACEHPRTLIIGPGTRIAKLTVEDTQIEVQISEAAVVGR